MIGRRRCRHHAAVGAAASSLLLVAAVTLAITDEPLASPGPITPLTLEAPEGRPLPRCGDDALQVDSSTRARAEAAAVCVINKLRRRRGRHRLQHSSQLYAAAQRHAADMVSRHYFSHTGRNGSTVADRVKATGYLDGAGTWTLGENLAWGTGSISTARAIVRGWMSSVGHRRALLRHRYRDAGLALSVGAPVTGIAESVNAGTYVHVLGTRR
jgi:uncharacterized protein YkwD